LLRVNVRRLAEITGRTDKEQKKATTKDNLRPYKEGQETTG